MLTCQTITTFTWWSNLVVSYWDLCSKMSLGYSCESEDIFCNNGAEPLCGSVCCRIRSWQWSLAASVFVCVTPHRTTVTATQPHAVKCQYDLKDQKATATKVTWASIWNWHLCSVFCWSGHILTPSIIPCSVDLVVTLASCCGGGGYFDADLPLLSPHTLDLFLKFLLQSHAAAAAASVWLCLSLSGDAWLE